MNFSATESSLTSVGAKRVPFFQILVAINLNKCPQPSLPCHWPLNSMISPSYIGSLVRDVWGVAITAISSVNGFLNWEGSILMDIFLTEWFSFYQRRQIPDSVHYPILGYSAYILFALNEFYKNISYPQLLARLVHVFSICSLGLECCSATKRQAKYEISIAASILNLNLESINMKLPIRMIRFQLIPSTQWLISTSLLHCGQNHALLVQQQLHNSKINANLIDTKKRNPSSIMKGTNCTDQGIGCKLQMWQRGNYTWLIGDDLLSDISTLIIIPNLKLQICSNIDENGIFKVSPYIIQMIYYLITLALISTGLSITCGVGIPILTRIPNEKGTYTVADQCLCPIDYYGIQCRNHRRISCYLQTKQYDPQFVDPNNFKQQKQLSVIFSAQCYIQDKNNQFVSFADFFIKKNIEKSFVEYELQSGKQGGQIIWANDSTILTQDGHIKYQEGYNYTLNDNGEKVLSAEDQQTIIYGNGPYKFTYKSQFLGFPFTNSNFSVVTNIFKILLSKRTLPSEKIKFINYDDYKQAIDQNVKKQEEAKKYIDNFSYKDLFNGNKFSIDEIKKQIQNFGADITKLSKMEVIPLIKTTFVAKLRDETQFGVLKAQIKLEQTYQDITRAISINSAVARIPIRVQGVGYAKIYNPNFYKAKSRIIYFVYGVIIIGIAYGLYRFYELLKERKLKKIKKQVEDQFEVKQFR